MAKIRHSPSTISRKKKPQFGDQVVAAMTGNTHFADAAEMLAPFATANTSLKTKLAELEAARTLVKEKLAAVEAAETEWDTTSVKLADDLQSASGGDAMKLQSTAFDVRTLPAPVGELAAPAKLTATTNGLTGVIKLRGPRVRGATNYVFQRTTNPNDEASWQQIGMPPRASYVDEELTSGTKYWYRMAANGTAGLGPWSQVVWKMAA